VKVISDAEFKAHGMLGELGIQAGLENGYLTVNRTSMVQFSNSREGEQGAYDEVLSFLQEEFPEYRVSWGGRTDEHLLAIFYERPL
jgi:hypothetical protein